jgi:hypothetical protein
VAVAAVVYSTVLLLVLVDLAVVATGRKLLRRREQMERVAAVVELVNPAPLRLGQTVEAESL